MTRINVIPVWELSDQHLLAEYRELPRVLKQNISTVGAKSYYHLGPGHMKWGRRHWNFCLEQVATPAKCDDNLCREFTKRKLSEIKTALEQKDN